MEKERPTCPTASAMKQYINCPRSYLMSVGQPSESGADAEHGTLLHKVIADGIQGTFGDEILSQEDKIAIEKCYSFFSGIYENNPNADVLVEKRLFVGDKFSGQIDVLLLVGKSAVVIDWKFGVKPVDEAQDNLQLMAYAWLVSQNYPTVEEVQVRIYQPNVIGGKAETVGLYLKDDLQAVDVKMRQFVDGINKSDCPIASDVGDYCQYCRARGICPTQQQNVLAVCDNATAQIYSNLQITVDNAVDVFGKIKLFKKRMTEAKKWIEAVEARLEAYATESQDERFEFKNGRRSEAYDTIKTYESISDVIKPTEFLQCCKVNKTALVGKLAELSEISKSMADELLRKCAEENDAVTVSYGNRILTRKDK